ncbi:MAG: ABC transporter permease [bacterium]
MLAVKNLLRNPIRSILTILGVAMGIAMLVSVTGYSDSIGSQLQNTVTNRYQLVVLSAGARGPLSSRISSSDLPLIRKLQGISEAQPVIIGSAKADKIPFLLLIGVSSSKTMAGNISLFEGQWFRPKSSEIIMGHNAAQRLRLGVGEQFSLQRQRFEISGIYHSPSNFLNQAAVVSVADAQLLLDIRDRVNVIFLKLDPGRGVKSISSKFAEKFPHLQMTRTADLLGSIEFFVVVERVTDALGLIAVVFCILITMNTLLISLFERNREIAILMAIGWSRFMIARSLVLESLMISVFGAVLGIMIGLGVIYRYSQTDIRQINWGSPELSTDFVLFVFCLSVLIAVSSAIYPILLASRVSPAEILQRD